MADYILLAFREKDEHKCTNVRSNFVSKRNLLDTGFGMSIKSQFNEILRFEILKIVLSGTHVNFGNLLPSNIVMVITILLYNKVFPGGKSQR